MECSKATVHAVQYTVHSTLYIVHSALYRAGCCRARAGSVGWAQCEHSQCRDNTAWQSVQTCDTVTQSTVLLRVWAWDITERLHHRRVIQSLGGQLSPLGGELWVRWLDQCAESVTLAPAPAPAPAGPRFTWTLLLSPMRAQGLAKQRKILPVKI